MRCPRVERRCARPFEHAELNRRVRRPDLTLLGRSVVEFPARPLVVLWPAAASRMAAKRRSASPGVLLRSSLPVTCGKHDLELIELIPLGIGPLPLRNRQQRLQSGTGRSRLRIIHGAIISSITAQRSDGTRAKTRVSVNGPPGGASARPAHSRPRRRCCLLDDLRAITPRA